MNKLRLVALLNRLKDVTYELECELKGDKESYLPPRVKYEEILEYYQTNDNDSEEGL